MEIFPEVNKLEIAHRHPLVNLLILRGLFVKFKLRKPVDFSERRDTSGYYFPAGDAQSTSRKACYAAYYARF